MGEKISFKKNGRLIIFGVIALIGFLLLIFGNSKSLGKEAESDSHMSLDPAAYSLKVEREVVRLCKSVAGDCEVNAVVSLEGGYRSVYASDSQSSSSGYKNSTVLVGSGSDEGAVLVCYENPEISGIGIVLSCKEDEYIKNSIVRLVSSAFNVGTNKIHVAFGGQ